MQLSPHAWPLSQTLQQRFAGTHVAAGGAARPTAPAATGATTHTHNINAKAIICEPRTI
jgi:hypothetical protein